jgi:hypothetical protein
MLEALKRSSGIVSTAADMVGISRTTHYSWIDADPKYKEAVEEINEAAIDEAESRLRERMNGVEVQKESKDGPVIYELPPDVTALIFYLKTKGKKRGYVERQEITGAEGGPLAVIEIKPVD